MRILACLIGRQIRIPFDHGVSRHVEILQMPENSEAAVNKNSIEILVQGQTNDNSYNTREKMLFTPGVQS